MRAILVSWLVEVHLKYKLLPETLYIAVNLVDRFCASQTVARSDYQLLGVTAMLIACKYEEIYVPKINEFVDITDNTYTREQILELEFRILKELDYNVTFPTTYRFVERFHHITDGPREVFELACYLLELCLVEVRMNRWLPSRIACSALYLSRKMLKAVHAWPRSLAETTQLSEKAVRESSREICLLINLAHQRKVFEPIYKKYST